MRLDSISTVVLGRDVLNTLRMALLFASVGPTFTFCRFNALFSFFRISIITISLAYAPHSVSASFEYRGTATVNIHPEFGGGSFAYVDPVQLSLCDPYLRADAASLNRSFIETKTCVLNTPVGPYTPTITGYYSHYITPTWIGNSAWTTIASVTKSCNAGDRLTSHSPVPYGTCTNNTCNAPSVWSPLTNKCTTPDKNPPQSCNASSPYPINYATGNKILAEQDYTLNASNAVAFTRHYNSRLNTGGLIGTNWLGNMHSQILVDSPSSVTGSSLIMVRGDSLKLPFTYSGSAWISDADITDKLTELKDTAGARVGWTYTQSKTNKVETYDVTGKLLSIADRSGYMQSFSYDSSNRIVTINDGLGRALHFSYDATNRISTLTNPAGGAYTYAYSIDGNNNLTSVIYPDGKTKTYLYENTTFKNALTGILDENSSRYMTYTYDTNGRATDEISPTFGTNVNHYAISYNPGISTTVTDTLGA
ncbi:MAG: hypothetical protein CTY35_12755, partial [Methylotenera sp.]|uniref:DUF6531 domain-containing protein n=1 Tax=Methylotenera sp. TaxID=2051956 RepID=UPI000D4976AC